jgi:hypothetical protein
MNIKTGLALATTAAALFSMTTPVLAASHAGGDMMVKCSGVNSCKGTSECKTAKSECKGQNGCKGQGWVNKKSAAECTKEGGTVVK